MENIEYIVRNIYFVSDSQVAIKMLDSFEINFKLVRVCYQSLVKLAKHKRIHLFSGETSTLCFNSNIKIYSLTQLSSFGLSIWTHLQAELFLKR